MGGILIESRFLGTAFAWVAIGVGVNVAKPDDQPDAAGMPQGVKRVDVLAAIVSGVRAAASRSGHLSPNELAVFDARDALKGRRISKPVAGVAAGIAANGALLVESASGLQHCRTGTIVLAEES